MSQSVFEKIKKLLDENKIRYKVLKHEPVFTSEQAAKARGFEVNEGMRRGAKAMVLKADDNFIQCVVPGNRVVNMKNVRKLLHVKSIRLATAEEVIKFLDCEPGSVPPFASLFNIPVYADKNLAEEIDFNAGLHDTSITIKRVDWEMIVKPIIVDIAGERAMS
jgi:Ala-tRNA(Pro) deacylase